MTSIEKIIKRIEKGDAVSILAEDSLVQILNELLKYEFIDMVGDKLVVTHKGREASLIGIDKVLSRLKIQEELKEFSVEVQRKAAFVFKMWLILCLCILVLFIAGIISDFQFLF